MPSKDPRTPSFSAKDFDALDAWLLRRRTGIIDITELEGFLTAIVIGPHTLSPIRWLPRVWGGKQPRFRDLDELNHFTSLVMGLYNDVALWFECDPAHFEPTFAENRAGRQRILIVDEWCVGFLKGIRLDVKGWKPLKRERPDLLRPLELFGSRRGWKELEAGGEGKMHRQWSVRVAPAVREIHRYWLPYRRATVAAPPSEQRH